MATLRMSKAMGEAGMSIIVPWLKLPNQSIGKTKLIPYMESVWMVYGIGNSFFNFRSCYIYIYRLIAYNSSGFSRLTYCIHLYPNLSRTASLYLAACMVQDTDIIDEKSHDLLA